MAASLHNKPHDTGHAVFLFSRACRRACLEAQAGRRDKTETLGEAVQT